jgi:RNA polymerase sigma-70 factor, ECF subfamily
MLHGLLSVERAETQAGHHGDAAQADHGDSETERVADLLSAGSHRATEPAEFEIDVTTKRLTWSSSMIAVLGLSEPLEPDLDVVIASKHPDDRSITRSKIEEAIRCHQPFSYPSRIVRCDGLLRTVESVGTVAAATDGSPRAITGSVTVISDWESPDFERPSSLRPRSEGNLAVALLAHVEEAHAYAFRAYASAVARAAYRVLHNHAQVEDVVQNVFEELWRRPSRFDPCRSSLTTFLQLQARGRSIDLVRSENSRSARASRSTFGVSPVSSAEEDFIASIPAIKVRRVLELLPRTERESIELAYFSHMTYREVATYLGMPEGTVKSRIRSGLNRLRDLND